MIYASISRRFSSPAISAVTCAGSATSSIFVLFKKSRTNRQSVVRYKERFISGNSVSLCMVCGQTNLACYDETPRGIGAFCMVCEEASIYAEDVYTPRNAEASPLYQAVSKNLETFRPVFGGRKRLRREVEPKTPQPSAFRPRFRGVRI